ncbi:hypothetical protein F5Y19DRAFT_467519 [Xylariaceae sp. FL1651]|nr:hypothetical protein F5Y19DRAFT_467519 [Xylariaceae sp. FL1651]
MAWLLILLLLLSGCSVAWAGSLNDFSNNLATDVGPLLSLFGENITRQYFSESTQFLDYFIFAMAPIGIVTALSSAIRVCGDSTLRAFIGRAQEGDGAIEAELCTSTSRDVCELFHKGGITRVFGKPKILELILIRDALDENDGEHMNVYLFREHLRSPPKNGEWVEPMFQNPNLSINIGIKKLPQWMFYAVAILGFVLQTGTMVMAAVICWIWQKSP